SPGGTGAPVYRTQPRRAAGCLAILAWQRRCPLGAYRMTSLALMYHGISSARHPLSAMPAEDRPYALDEQAFARHLQCIGSAPVLLTFDDGDAGWFYSVLPL